MSKPAFPPHDASFPVVVVHDPYGRTASYIDISGEGWWTCGDEPCPEWKAGDDCACLRLREADEDEARAAIYADLDAGYALNAFNAALPDAPVADWTGAEPPF